MARSWAIRSASGGCLLKRLEKICPADSGCTIIRAELWGEHPWECACCKRQAFRARGLGRKDGPPFLSCPGGVRLIFALPRNTHLQQERGEWSENQHQYSGETAASFAV